MQISARIILALVTAFAVCWSGDARAANASKIILQDGTVYEDVVFMVEKAYKVIAVTKGDWERTISFGDVAYIYNDDGDDVTQDYLGMIYRKPDPTPNPPPDTASPTTVIAPQSTQGVDQFEHAPEESKKRQLHPWGLAIKTGGNFSIPTSDFYDGFTSGFGYEGDLIIPVARNLAVRLSASKSGMRDDPERLLSFMGPYELIEDNVTVNVWRFAVSAQYYEWPKWRQGGRWMYHFYSGIGIINHSVSGEYAVKNTQSGEEGVIVPTGKDLTRFLLVLGLGTMAKLDRHIGLEASFEFEGVAIGSNPNSYSYYTAVQYAYIFDFKAGMVWLF